MSIIIPDKYTSPVFFQESDYRIVKYLDLTKFISLLKKKSLFFCRLDKLEDHFEGTTAKSNFLRRKHFYETQHLRSPKFKKLTEEEVLQNVKKQFEADERMKALKCICCWNKSETESAALWKIYADFQKGIMITSSMAKLQMSFRETTEDISLSEVEYINHNSDLMPDGNMMFPVIYKHVAYSFEKEVRLIHSVKFKNGLVYDWTKEEVEQGKYIDVDLDILIEDIVISPYSPNWYIEIIQDLCEKYELNRTIKKSELSRN